MRYLSLRLLAFVVVLVIVFGLARGVALAQTDTPTPITVYAIIVTATPTDTPEPTEGPSPTPTETPTLTPDFRYEATVEVDGVGQDVAFEYQMSVGDLANFIVTVFIACVLLLLLVLQVKR